MGGHAEIIDDKQHDWMRRAFAWIERMQHHGRNEWGYAEECPDCGTHPPHAHSQTCETDQLLEEYRTTWVHQCEPYRETT